MIGWLVWLPWYFLASRMLERDLLLEPDDFRRITYEYLEDAARENVRHAEFFWNPTASVRDSGLSYEHLQEAIVRGMAQARADFGISSYSSSHG